MSKLTKLIQNPLGFVRDGIDNYLSRRPNLSQYSKAPLFLIGFSSAWKSLLGNMFPHNSLIYIGSNITTDAFNKQFKKCMLASSKVEVLIWGMKCPPFILNFARENSLNIKFVEDGFIRSVHLGSNKAPPCSWNFDSRTPYFDHSQPSDLEVILSTYDFNSNPSLIENSRKLIKFIVSNHISKYNNSLPVNLYKIYGPKTAKRILVIGQIEDDASITYGCSKPVTNTELLSIACNENPDAQIFYKEHPDILSGNRINNSDITKITTKFTIIKQDIPLSQAFQTIDHVYTITSLSGFEALLRDIKVTTLGCPFYAGWGLTDDRQINPRRERKLSKEELFAGAYLLYPRYFDPRLGHPMELSQVLDLIVSERASFYADGQVNMSHFALRAPTKTSSKAAAPASVEPVRNSVTAAMPTPATAERETIPTWFNAHPTFEFKQALSANKPLFLYIPWIAEHGDTLIAKLKCDDYVIAPLDVFNGIEDNQVRREIFSYARKNPDLYRRMLIRRLVPLSNRIQGIIFTFDWAAIMHVLSNVCEELEIPRILIPHESVFVDRTKYYWDPTAQASVPVADVVLSWGGLQRDIFAERGYPKERILPVGAPKFDIYVNYQNNLTRQQFNRLFGLSNNRKTILFASQPLDSQLNSRVARESQRQAIRDLFYYAQEHNHQLLVRLPPSKDNILGAPLRRELESSEYAAIDDALCYLVSPEEALYHADLVTSVNSTMLFEGLLQGKPALSMKYVEFDQIWSQAGIPAVTNSEQLREQLAVLLEQPGWQPSPEGMAWAANMFSCGQFDGQASTRIRHYLTGLVTQQIPLTLRPSPLQRLTQKQPLDVVSINLPGKMLENGMGSPLRKLLLANQLLSSDQSKDALMLLSSTDLFIQWHGAHALSPQTLRKHQPQLGRELAYMSPGFISSLASTSGGDDMTSVVIDSRGHHFDSSKQSAMSQRLESSTEFPSEQLQQSQLLIQRIRQLRVTRDSGNPDIPLQLGGSHGPKILVLDRYSLDPAQGPLEQQQALFADMLTQVLHQCGNKDVIVHQKQTNSTPYLLTESLQKTLAYSMNVHIVQADIHPHALLDLADELYLIDDHLGFEALMADKCVHCFGKPFYAGWGLTQDYAPAVRKTRHRSLEELFYVSYIEFSRYLDPRTGESTTLNKLIQSMGQEKRYH